MFNNCTHITKHFSYAELNKEGLPITINRAWNLTQLALYLEVVRHNFGYPIIVTSGLRSVKHNKEVGGVSNSLHLFCKAVDITCENPTKDVFEKLYFACTFKLPASLQRYIEYHPEKRYIHIGFGSHDDSLLNLCPYLPFGDYYTALRPE